jgi:hypothetical protein
MPFEDYIEEHSYIVSLGCYATQLEKYFQRFSSDQIKILIFDDLLHNPAGLMEQVYLFLGVDPAFRPDLSRAYNSAPQHRRKLRTIASQIKQLTFRSAKDGAGQSPPMKYETRKRLVEYFAPEIEAIESLISRDLSSWRAVY